MVGIPHVLLGVREGSYLYRFLLMLIAHPKLDPRRCGSLSSAGTLLLVRTLLVGVLDHQYCTSLPWADGMSASVQQARTCQKTSIHTGGNGMLKPQIPHSPSGGCIFPLPSFMAPHDLHKDFGNALFKSTIDVDLHMTYVVQQIERVEAS